MKNQRSNKRDIENDDEQINENELKIKNFKYLFDSRFQFEHERFLINKRKTDR